MSILDALRKLISPTPVCDHKWTEEERSDIFRYVGDAPCWEKRLIGRASYCKCEKCGERRAFRMTP